jgi:alpha-beta hydrolase superfamily lysophospholipase
MSPAVRRVSAPALLLAAAAILLAGCGPVVRGLGPARVTPAIEVDDRAAAAPAPKAAPAPGAAAAAAAAPEVTPEFGGVRAIDGYRLPLRHWPADGPPRAIVIGLHGFNDYSNAFAEPAAWFARRGIATYAYDQRGFGATEDAGYWAGTEALVADLDAVVTAVRARHPGVPVTLLGESMGGAVIMVTMAGPQPPPVAGIVLAAPAVWGWSTLPAVARGALWVGAYTMPWNLLVPPRNLRIRASDNTAMLRALGRDPLVIKRTRIDAVYGLTDLMEEAWSDAGRIRAPTLLLYGAKDQLIPPKPVAQVGAALAPVARMAVYPSGWHMLLRDKEAEIVWRDVAAWTLDHAAPLPSGDERAPGEAVSR